MVVISILQILETLQIQSSKITGTGPRRQNWKMGKIAEPIAASKIVHMRRITRLLQYAEHAREPRRQGLLGHRDIIRCTRY